MVGAIVLSPTDAASQEAVVDSAQRVVVTRARAPRDPAVQHYLEYLGSGHPDFELEGSARLVVQFEGILPELHHASRMRRLTSIDRSALSLTFRLRYTNSFVWMYTWSAASTLNVVVDSGIPFVRKHMISVLAFDTARPNAAHTTMITPSSCSAARGITRRSRHRQRKACLKVASTGGLTLRQLLPPAPPAPPAPLLSFKCTKASMMSLPALKRVYCRPRL